MNNKHYFSFFVLVSIFSMQAISGSFHDSLPPVALSALAGVILLKSQQPEGVDRFITSWPNGQGGSSSGQANSGQFSGASNQGRSQHTGTTAFLKASLSLSGSEEGDDEGDDEDEPKKKQPADQPDGAYCISPEITIELVSVEPLVFRIRIPKEALRGKKLNSNTPWITLTSENSSTTALLSLYIGQPDQTTPYYRIFPLLRLSSQPVPPATRLPFHLFFLPSVYPTTSPGGRHTCMIYPVSEQLALDDPFNTVTEAVGFTHQVNSIPNDPQEFTVNLSYLSQDLQATNQLPAFSFSFSDTNYSFRAQCPLLQNGQLVNHCLNAHQDHRELFSQDIRDLKPLPGCEKCQSSAPLPGYPEWRSEWNRAAEQSDVLEFEIAIILK